MSDQTKKGSVEFAVIFCALVVFIFLPLFGTLAQKALLYQKKEIVHQSANLASMAAYTSLNANQAGIGEQSLLQEEFNNVFQSVLCANLKLDQNLVGYPHSIATGKVDIISLTYVSENLPVTVGNRIFMYPFIRCEIKVPVSVDILAGWMNQDKLILHEVIYTELPFDK
mgnify:CR=1 FL=1